VKITIFGDPISKMRPRFARRGKYVSTFDPQEEQKLTIKELLKQHFKECLESNDVKIATEAKRFASTPFFECELSFHIKAPESWSSALKNEKIWGITKCDNKCDLDNYEKFYLDCMNKIIFNDDKQIVILKSSKHYSLDPRVEINISSISSSDITEEAKGVLRVLGPSEVRELFELCYELHCLIKDARDDDVNPNCDLSFYEAYNEIQLSKTAIILSELADKYAVPLKKIKTNYGNLWKDVREDYTTNKEVVLSKKTED